MAQKAACRFRKALGHDLDEVLGDGRSKVHGEVEHPIRRRLDDDGHDDGDDLDQDLEGDDGLGTRRRGGFQNRPLGPLGWGRPQYVLEAHSDGKRKSSCP